MANMHIIRGARSEKNQTDYIVGVGYDMQMAFAADGNSATFLLRLCGDRIVREGSGLLTTNRCCVLAGVLRRVEAVARVLIFDFFRTMAVLFSTRLH